MGPVDLEGCLTRCVRFCQVEQKSFLNCCDIAKQFLVKVSQVSIGGSPHFGFCILPTGIL